VYLTRPFFVTGTENQSDDTAQAREIAELLIEARIGATNKAKANVP
jgi:hypothetical protein